MAKIKRKRQYDKNPVCNRKIRALMAMNGLRYGELAKKLFISQSTLSQWFMHEMKPWQREEVIKAIGEIVWERGFENEDEDKESIIRSYMDACVGNDMDVVSSEAVRS